MLAIVEFLFVVVVDVFTGWVPERPKWLRRVMQAFWGLLLLLVVALAGLGVVYLFEAL